MSFSAAINELSKAKMRTENAYYALRNLRTYIEVMQAEGKPLTQNQITEMLDDALRMLQEVIEGK